MGETPTKFRALPTNSKKKKWVYGGLVTINGKKWIVNEEGYYTEVLKDTVCFCTGLKDKNGKTIYEGDILRANWYPYYDDSSLTFEKYYAVIEWDKHSASFVAVKWKSSESNISGISNGFAEIDFGIVRGMEVLGNIIKDKDLLGNYESVWTK